VVSVLFGTTNTNDWAKIKVGTSDSSTTSVTDGVTVGHKASSGTPAAGMGSGVLFTSGDSTTADVNQGEVYTTWTTATHNSNVSDFVVKLDNGSTTPAEAFRVTGAGVASAGGVTIPTISSTNTLTNKRITKRVLDTNIPSSPVTPDGDSYDGFVYRGINAALTINAFSGTPTAMQPYMFRFKDDGTGRALTFTTGSSKAFRPICVALPTTTVANKTTYLLVVYNSTDDRLDTLATGTEP
jgi:hypothetical protein